MSGCLALASEPPGALSGCWTIFRALPTTDVAALSQSEVDKLIGTRLMYSRECSKSGSTERRSPKYKETTLSAREFAERVYPISLKQLGIEGSTTTMVSIGSAADHQSVPVAGETVLLGGQRPIIEFQGVFFELQKAESSDVECACAK
jgi:hypothetical protein